MGAGRDALLLYVCGGCLLIGGALLAIAKKIDHDYRRMGVLI